MKHLFLLLFALLTMANSGIGQTASDSLVVLNEDGFPTKRTFVVSGDSIIPNVPVMLLYFCNNSSEDLKITALSLQTYLAQGYQLGSGSEKPNFHLQAKNLQAYSEATGLFVGQVSAFNFDFGVILFDLPLDSKFIIPKHQTKTLRLELDSLDALGSFGIYLSSATAVDEKNNTSTLDLQSLSLMIQSPLINVVNTEVLKPQFTILPSLGRDTVYVLPGQQFWSAAYFRTPVWNYLPNAIMAFQADVGLWRINFLDEFRFTTPLSMDSSSGAGLFCGQPHLWENGTVSECSNSNQYALSWLSNTSLGGIDQYTFGFMSGYNNLPIGMTMQVDFHVEVTFYNAEMKEPILRWKSFYQYVKSIDGIRGDIDGNGVVNKADVDFLLGEYNAHGGFNESCTYSPDGINVGRGLLLFKGMVPGFLEIWLLNIYVNNPHDPLVQGLDIGQLMSERPPLTSVPTISSLSGNTMTVKTKGFAVNISAIMPDGKVWSKCERVSGGQVAIDVPDANLKYRVESVSLPSGLTGVDEEMIIPTKFDLSQNYPNPFNPTTTISYSVPNSGPVTLKVYNLLGQEVATLFNGERSAGNYTADFNANKLSSGIYIYRLSAGNFTSAKKMVLTK